MIWLLFCVQERGEIFFFYRPKVEREEAHSSDDVQRLYIVLRPESGERSVEEKQDSHSGKEGSKITSNKKDHPSTGDSSSSSSHQGGHGSQVIIFSPIKYNLAFCFSCNENM